MLNYVAGRRAWLALTCLGLLVSGAWAGDGDAIAIVNGQPISRQRLVAVLMEAHGLQVMQQLIVLELAKEETRRLKLKVTDEDVEREFQNALQRIAPESDAQGQLLSAAERQKALEMLLSQKGLTMTEFRLGMERNAHLRKVVEGRLTVTETTLREEFARLYGERVEVRHIQVADISGLHEALNQLDSGKDFAAVAQTVSQNPETAPRGGLLEPFAFNDDSLAPVLREAAFALAPGEVSKPIRVGRWWHILKLERRLPPAEVRFEDVRAEVERRLRERVVPQEMNRLISDLFQKAQIRILDSALRDKYEKLLAENRLTGPDTGP